MTAATPGPLDAPPHLNRLEFGASPSVTLVDAAEVRPSDTGAPFGFSASLAANGEAVTFGTTQAFVAGDTNGLPDIYVRVYR